MKTKKESTTPAVLNQYTAQFKEQALERAERDGIPKVAQDLGLAESMLYSWRAKRRQRTLRTYPGEVRHDQGQ